MKAHRRNKLLAIIGGIVCLGAAVGLILYALSNNIDHFYAPTQVASGEAPLNKNVRVGGLVVAGSVKRATNGLEVEFVLTDNQSQVTVQYDGILPDLFREGQGIIAIGELTSKDTFAARQILAKHDENYMAPEIQDSLDKYGHPNKPESNSDYK